MSRSCQYRQSNQELIHPPISHAETAPVTLSSVDLWQHPPLRADTTRAPSPRTSTHPPLWQACILLRHDSIAPQLCEGAYGTQAACLRGFLEPSTESRGIPRVVFLLPLGMFRGDFRRWTRELYTTHTNSLNSCHHGRHHDHDFRICRRLAERRCVYTHYTG